jgi:hypothetical protein
MVFHLLNINFSHLQKKRIPKKNIINKDVINTKRWKFYSNTHRILNEYLIKQPNIFPPQIK